ncbi:MAG: serine/threonine protein kinase [Deltaproteobacteria bacterium]|nr:serine/threonine protein kinase [Deltaproteobacteria bacterium]
MQGLSVGGLVADRYKLRRRVGEGATGVVWEAAHALTRKRVALKILKAGASAGRQRFEREVKAAAAASHPHVVEVFDFFEWTEGTFVIVMELLEGETLGERLRREGRLALGDVATLLVPAISALGSAHSHGIIHRDFKPENVFLVRGGVDPPTVKVVDFGIAKVVAASGDGARSLTLTGGRELLGTPYYMAPEQIFLERVDARTDVWSVGVVLYECLAGTRPTEAENMGAVMRRIMNADFVPLRERAPHLPEEVTSLVTRMLRTDPNDRPAHLGEVLEVLEAYTTARAPSFGPPLVAEAIVSDSGVRPSDPSAETQRLDAARVPDERSDTHGGLELALAHGRRRRIAGVSAVASLVLLSAVLAYRSVSSSRQALRSSESPAESGPRAGAVQVRMAESSARSEPATAASLAVVTPPLPSATATPTPHALGSATSMAVVTSPAPTARRAAASASVSAAAAPTPPAAKPSNDQGGIVDVPPF